MTLLSLTVVLLVNFAIKLFEEDKSATVYEATLNSSLSLAERLDQYMESNLSTFNLLKSFSTDRNTLPLKKIFAQNKGLISFSAWELVKGKRKLNVYLENDLFLKSHEVKSRAFFNLDKVFETQGKDIEVIDAGLDSQHLIMARREKNSLFISRFSLDKPLKELNEKSQYKNFLVFNDTILSSSKGDDLQKYSLKPLSNKLKSLGELESSRVTRLSFDNSHYIAAISPVAKGVLTLSLVAENTAFKAAEFLKTQSVTFGGLIFSLTVIFGIIISRKITFNLGLLHDASLAYAKGDFNQEIQVKSQDEIGNLATTFKKMGAEIVKYIEEMKDKARLEKEMEVAKLVQESFISSEGSSFDDVSIYPFYQAASECGGDWWGEFSRGDWTTIVVADATGHGVPAALLTATASGCLHNIEYELEKKDQDFMVPNEVLSILNHAIYKMGGKIHMTAFTLVFNRKTGQAMYSNASHNQPLLIVGGIKDGSVVSKDDFIPLMENNGKRLGEDIHSTYEKTELVFHKGDFIFMFSDGLVEQTNPEEKQWGNRKFFKTLSDSINLFNKKELTSPGDINLNIIKELKEFSEGKPWDDDITLIGIAMISHSDGESSEEFQLLKDDSVLCGLIENDKIYGEVLKVNNLKHVIRSEDELSIISTLEESEDLTFDSLDFPIDQIETLSVFDSKVVEQEIDHAISRLKTEGFFDSPVSHFSLISRELASNALFHQSIETSVASRKDGVLLSDDMGVVVQLCVGEKGLGVLVEDKSGRLKYDEFKRALVRGFHDKSVEKKEGGAGLGLYLIFQNANYVAIEVKPGVSTKFIAIIEKEKRYKKYKEKNTVFHYLERKT